MGEEKGQMTEEGKIDWRLMNVDFGFLMWSLPGAEAHLQAHFANQHPAISNRQSMEGRRFFVFHPPSSIHDPPSRIRPGFPPHSEAGRQ
jgi:hypothetical protein